MNHKTSRIALQWLSVGILAGLPLLASAQAMRGFDVSPPPAPPPTSVLRTVNNPIAGSYLVVLKPSAAALATESNDKGKIPSISSVADNMASMYGVAVTQRYNRVLRGFAIDANAQTLAQLLTDPRIAYVQEDSVVVTSAIQMPATWGLDRIDQANRPINNMYTYNSTAQNVHVYVLDTGLRSSHQEFAGRVGLGTTTIIDGIGTGDCQGHGTHVAGTIAGTNWGVAKGVTVVPVRIFGCSGTGATRTTVAGLDWVAQNHQSPAVANMSFSTQGGIDPLLDGAVTSLIESGVVVVTIAGNNNGANACDYSPGRVANAITVGSTESNDSRSASSNKGSCVDLFAPGSGIVSASHLGDTLSRSDSGTSMAAPHVAGAAALYLATHPAETPAQVAAALINNASPGKVTNIDSNTPNRLLYTLTTLPPNQPLHAGFSGAWYYPNTTGQGMVIQLTSQPDVAFAGWYSFAPNGQTTSGPAGQRWYTVQGAYTPGSTDFTLPVYQTVGGRFVDPLPTTTPQIGWATVSFQSCSTGRFEYQVTVDGVPRAGTIPLTRLGSPQFCLAGSPSYSLSLDGINSTLNGAWYNPNQSGQGFQFQFSPVDSNLAFIAWYTFDPSAGAGTGANGQRWYTIQGTYPAGSSQVSGLRIYESTGGRFDVVQPITHNPVGTVDLSFSSCTAATLTYHIDGRPTGTIQLSRLTGGGDCMP